jgi:hypothetical protein
MNKLMVLAAVWLAVIIYSILAIAMFATFAGVNAETPLTSAVLLLFSIFAALAFVIAVPQFQASWLASKEVEDDE